MKYKFTILEQNDIETNLIIDRETGKITLVSTGVLLEIETNGIKSVTDYNFATP